MIQSGSSAVLVITTLDDASAVALQRGHALAEIFHARLCVLHPLTHGVRPLLVREAELKRWVLRWAAARAKVLIAERDVVLGLGDPVRSIVEAADGGGAQLVVVGGEQLGSDVELRDLLTLWPGSLFIARPRRTACEIVAATDLRERYCPIARTGAQLARVLSARLTLVHDRDARAEERSRRRGPDRRLAGARRLRGEAAALEIDVEPEAAPQTSADVIAEAIRTRDADIAVIGVPEGCPDTLLGVVERTRCSVFSVPVTPLVRSGGAG